MCRAQQRRRQEPGSHQRIRYDSQLPSWFKIPQIQGRADVTASAAGCARAAKKPGATRAGICRWSYRIAPAYAAILMSGSRCAASHSTNGFPTILRRGSQFSARSGLDRRRTATVSVHVHPNEVRPSMRKFRSPLAVAVSSACLGLAAHVAAERRRRNRHHHLQLRAARRDPAGVLSADPRAGRAERHGRSRLRAGARRPRDEDQAGPLAAVVHRRGRAHRSDHGHVHLADGSGHARARAEFPVRPREHAEAAAQVHRSSRSPSTSRTATP